MRFLKRPLSGASRPPHEQSELVFGYDAALTVFELHNSKGKRALGSLSIWAGYVLGARC